MAVSAVKEPPGELMLHGDQRIGILRLQDQQLRHDVVRAGVVHLHAEEDDAVLEQLCVRVLTLVTVGVRSSKLGST